MAAGLIDHIWSVSELLSYRIPPLPWVAPKRPHRRSIEQDGSIRPRLRLYRGCYAPSDNVALPHQSVHSTAKGTAQARITFISDVKWGAKIITSGVRTSWTNIGSFVDIRGFDITGDGEIGINNYGSYVHIIGNHAHNYAFASCSSLGAAGIDDSPYLGNH